MENSKIEQDIKPEFDPDKKYGFWYTRRASTPYITPYINYRDKMVELRGQDSFLVALPFSIWEKVMEAIEHPNSSPEG